MKNDLCALIRLVALMPLIFMTSTPAVAQSSGSDTIEEIIVTSRKLGAENLQEIPASISAFDSDALREMMVVDFEDFARQVPGLTFLDTSPGERRYVIRGIQSAGQQQVAVYYDEVPLPGVQSSTSDSGSQTTDLKLYDMERVEVLRGPQGTVFGANSQAGTVRFITRQPDLSGFDAYAGVELSRTTPSADNNYNVQAVANIPFNESFGARVLVYDGEDAGYIDNTRCRATNPAEDPRLATTLLSCLNQQDYNWSNTTGFRSNFLWQVNDRASFKGQFWWQDRQTGGDARYHPYDAYNPSPTHPVYAGNADSVAAFTFFEEGEFRSGDYALTPKPDEQTIYSVTGEFDVGIGDLSATVSRYERDFGYKFDSTWIITFLLQGNLGNLPCSDPASDPATCLRADLLYALTDQKQTLEQDAFEIRLSSKNPDAAVQWVVGAFYRSRESNFQSFVPVVNTEGVTFSPPNPPTLPPTSAIGAGVPGCHPCVFARVDDKDIEESALFGEVNWAITDSLDLNVGLRWFDVDQTEAGSTVFQFAAFAPNPPDPTTPTGATPPSINKLSDDEIPWKIALGWHLNDDVTLFGSASTGYRLGGTNNRGIGQILIPEEFEADELTSYEFGVKSQLFGRRTTLNASIFSMEWENLQVAGQDLTGAFGFIGNAGTAEVQGIEAEIASAIGDNFYFTGQVTYLTKKELTEDQVSTDIVAPGLKGDEIPRVPEVTASFTAQYSFELPIADWLGAVRLEGSYTDDSFTELRPDAAANRFQDSYSIFNFRANFRYDPRNLDLTFFIENMFDERGDLFIGGGSGGQPTSKITNRPQTVGVQVTMGFGGS
ncbi:MAG: TonB-dependent receptor [Gammaproteobacteria bacterium]|nr:TonB-dependent receptor [Gammaproteobacteria bacterium]